MRDSQPDVRWDLLTSLRRLSDAELVARVKSLAARERRATVLLVAHLAELDTRDVHLRAGYSSLFAYCRDVLALSEHEAYNRIEVARAARRFRVVLEMLAAGSVNLTTARLLGPHLTAENHRAVLESARGKRKAEVEEIVARLSPRPEVPATVRKLPEPRSHARPAAEPPSASLGAPGAAAQLARGSAGSAPALMPSDGACGRSDALLLSRRGRTVEITPLSPDRYRLQLTIGGSTLEKLRLARDMLRHAVSSGDDEAVLDRALTLLLADLARRKFAASGRPRRSHSVASDGSRHIPAEVKRAVWLRDLGRCAFVGTDGRRCNERGFGEFHHVRPYAAGGEASAANIQLRCRRHNDYEVRVYFGKGQLTGDGKESAAGMVVREQAAAYGLRAPHARGLDSFQNELPPCRATARSIGAAARPALHFEPSRSPAASVCSWSD